MASVEDLFTAAFTIELLVMLVLLSFNAYLLTYRPIVTYLREIYFVNSDRFKRAWYEVIGAVSFFIIAQTIAWARRTDVLPPSPTTENVFQIAFGMLMIAAFLEVVLILRRYIPDLGSDDSVVARHITRDLRNSLREQDRQGGIQLNVAIGSDIYGGRPTLGPNVSLSHYRASIIGITQYLEHRFGELGETLLYSVGRQTGLGAAQSITDEGITPENLQREFFESVITASIGIPGIVRQDNEKLIVRLEECCICAGMDPAGEVSCHYINGLFAGFYEHLLDKDVESRETKCSGRKEMHCEFELTLLPRMK